MEYVKRGSQMAPGVGKIGDGQASRASGIFYRPDDGDRRAQGARGSSWRGEGGRSSSRVEVTPSRASPRLAEMCRQTVSWRESTGRTQTGSFLLIITTENDHNGNGANSQRDTVPRPQFHIQGS